MSSRMSVEPLSGAMLSLWRFYEERAVGDRHEGHRLINVVLSHDVLTNPPASRVNSIGENADLTKTPFLANISSAAASISIQAYQSHSLKMVRDDIESSDASSTSSIDELLREDSEGWEDAEPEENEEIQVKDFFSDQTFPDAASMIKYAAEQHNFDFLKITKDFGGFLSRVKMLQFVI